jgi:hypothetical protein
VIDLEFESLGDERADTRHHSLPRPLAAYIHVTVVRIAHEAVAASLQLLIELVEHQITQQR